MRMITNGEKKLIRSLRQKKFRNKKQLFIVEGDKLFNEVLESKFEVYEIFATETWVKVNNYKGSWIKVEESHFNKISNLKTPPGILALIKMPDSFKEEVSEITLLLENVQDPGNLGTIIRSADAFGVTTLVCSEGTVDCFSPKVVQATMGSLFRLNIIYTDLKSYLRDNSKSFTVYGAHLEGENLYQIEISKPAILVMGNESKGLTEEISELLNQKVRIPINKKVESLNVSMATTIILSEFQRRFSKS